MSKGRALRLISLLQAQAIMFLAGAGASISNIAHQKAQAQAHGMGAKMAAASDGAPKNQPVSTLPCPALSSPLSVSSHTGAQSGSGSSCSDELGGVKTNGLPTTPISKGEPPRIVNAVGPVAATAMLPSGMPIANKSHHFFFFHSLMVPVLADDSRIRSN